MTSDQWFYILSDIIVFGIFFGLFRVMDQGWEGYKILKRKKQFIKKYGNTAVQLKTLDQANEFLLLCQEFGINWYNGLSALRLISIWFEYNDKTCIYLRKLKKEFIVTYESKLWFESCHFTVIPFESEQKGDK